jgi:hypothetical protein
MGECFNCSRGAVRDATLEFESGLRLEDRSLCRNCFVFFEESAHIEVHGAPLLLRGGGDREQPEE